MPLTTFTSCICGVSLFMLRRMVDFVCSTKSESCSSDCNCYYRDWRFHWFVIFPSISCQRNPLQSFAAGAAWCSTNPGTKFTVLRTSGLSSTPLAVVLTTAAMMDDVDGLVMVQVTSNLDSSASPLRVITVLRPVLVSTALGVILPILCTFLVQPLTIHYTLPKPSL